MGNNFKNIATILGVLTLAFGAYYLYAQKSPSGDVAASQESLQTMLANTSVFISRSQELNQISLDISILEDSRFRSLQGASGPLQDQPIGRNNPFASGVYTSSSQ